MSSSKPIFSGIGRKFQLFPMAVIFLSLFTALPSAHAAPSGGGGSGSALELYLNALSNPHPGRRERTLWKKLRAEDLPDPLNRRAIFLKAWFGASDSPLTRKSLDPALKAFPGLAPVLLWHLAQGSRTGITEKAFLSGLLKGNRAFDPMARDSGGSGRARDLWRDYRGGLRSGSPDPEILARLVARHPLSVESALALRTLGQPGLDGQVLIPRWVKLQAMGSNDLVVRETRAYLASDPPFPYRDRALYLQARSMAIEGHAKKALSIAEAWRTLRLGSEMAALACRIHLSLDFPEGVRCVDRLRDRFPHALFLLPLTVSVLRTDLVHPLPSLDSRWAIPKRLWWNRDAIEGTWLLGLDYAMRGDQDSALAVWKGLSRWLESRHDRPPGLLSRVLYFMGRESERSGHPSRSRDLYARVVSLRDPSPYALWATIACHGECGSFRIHPHHPSSDPVTPPFVLRSMRDLLQMGLFGPALVLWRVSMNPGMDREQILRYGDLDLFVPPERYPLLVERAFSYSGTRRKLPSGEWLSAPVLEGFRRSGAPIFWALSIARQESRFRERVLSIDGALGVMQLMPRTALSVAAEEHPSLRKLLDRNLGLVRHPELNSLIGGLYLKRLIDSVPGHPERAIAAYNAGLHAVLSWKNLSRADWDYFTESIPYQETRRYVREVLWNYAYLEHRYGGRIP